MRLVTFMTSLWHAYISQYVRIDDSEGYRFQMYSTLLYSPQLHYTVGTSMQANILNKTMNQLPSQQSITSNPSSPFTARHCPPIHSARLPTYFLYGTNTALPYSGKPTSHIRICKKGKGREGQGTTNATILLHASFLPPHMAPHAGKKNVERMQVAYFI